MATQLQALLDAALQLPDADRGTLANKLYDSLDDASTLVDEDNWGEELKRRLDDHRSGKSVAVPKDEAMRLILEDSDA